MVSKKILRECLLRFRVRNGIALGSLKKYLKRGMVGKEGLPEDIYEIIEMQGS